MDQTDRADAGDPRADQQAVEQDGAASSEPTRESESSFMNRALRGLAGLVGLGSDASEDGAEPTDAETEATTPPAPQPPPVDEAAIQERVRREAQSLKDRELARERRTWAQERAESGDLAPLRQLAERGDPWAQRSLAENGDTWALGEIKQKELAAQQARENDPLPVIAHQFDQTVLHPLLGALPEADERRIVGDGIVGLDGRQRAVGQAIEALKRAAAVEASTKMLDDPAFVRDLLGDTAFRAELLKNPTTNKQLRAMFRGELHEPDLNPGSGPGRGGDLESDVMNDAIRAAWRGADLRAPDERAAGAGASTGRRAHRDLLDD